MNRRPATVATQRSVRCFTPLTSPIGDALSTMSRHSGRFVTLVATLFTISNAMADRSVHPSPMLDLADASNLTAIDMHDLDLAALFPHWLPIQEPPVYPSHPDELFEVLPPVVNQEPVQTPLIPTLRVTTEESYTTETAEGPPHGSGDPTEKHSEDGSTNQPSHESDVTVSETEGLNYETTQSEARETVDYNLRTPTEKESMPTTWQQPATPTQYEVRSTTRYETNLPTLYDTQPPVEYETNPPVRYETNPPITYGTKSPTHYEQSPQSLSTPFQTISVFKQQNTKPGQAYPTTALFVRMTDPREPTAYTPRDTYSTSLGYDGAPVSVIPTETQTRASAHPTKSTHNVYRKQTKPIPSRFVSTIRSFTKAKRPHFGEKLGHGAVRVKGPSDRPLRKDTVPSSNSKQTYNDINRRRKTKRPSSKQPTIKWVKIPSTRPPSTPPTKHYISEYKPIKIMHHRNPYRIRNRSTSLARTTTKTVATMKEAPATTEFIAPYNSHSKPKLQTSTPSYEVDTGRGTTELHSKPSFEISMNLHQQMNQELMSHLFDEKPAINYLEQQPAATTLTTEEKTTREVISTHPPPQTTATIKEDTYLRPATNLPHPSGSADKKRVRPKWRPDGSYQPLVQATKEPSYYHPSTVKAVAHLSPTKQPTRYRPQKLKPAVNLPSVEDGGPKKKYATSYVIPNNMFRKHPENRSGGVS